jgi:Type III restriction enzyme, res subunit
MLESSEKTKLIEKAKEVYFAYWNLETINKYRINGKTTTIKEFLQEKLLVVDGELQQNLDLESCYPITVGKHLLDLVVKKVNGQYELSLKWPDNQEANKINAIEKNQLKIKGLGEYTVDDITHQLLGSTFTIHFPTNNDGDLKFSTTLKGADDNSFQIGGPDKISLYKLHISNLGRIIEHLKTNDINSNMLVSLTTGSGKTFTQALMILVLKLSGLNGVFAVPGKLLLQYKEDLKRLLPDALVNHDHPQSLYAPGSKIIVDSVDEVLLNPSETQKNFPKNTLFSFDEAHLLADEEKKFVKAKKLAGNFTSLFLTATPTPALYELAQGSEKKKKKLKVVATMNNTQKVQNNYAEPAQSYSETAKSIQQMGNETGIKFQVRFQRWLADAVDPEKGYNAANAFGEAYLYNISKKKLFTKETKLQGNDLEKLRHAVRWNIQPSAFQGKMLICANHFEDIVNLDMWTKGSESPKENNSKQHIPLLSKEFYTNQNKFNRAETYSFLQMANDPEGIIPDAKIYKTYEESLHTNFQNQLMTEIKNVRRSLALDKTLDDEVEMFTGEIMQGLHYAPIANSAHGIIELSLSILASGALDTDNMDLLSILLNFGSAYLDQQRFENLDEFTRKIIANANKLNQRDLQNNLEKLLTYSPTNPRGINANSANKLAILITNFIKNLPGQTQEKQKKIIDNWFADQSIFSDNLVPQIFEFAKSHYKRFVFNKVEMNETIQKNEVFSTFEERKHMVGLAKFEEKKNTVGLAETEEDKDYKPKSRSKRPVEALNPNAEEFVYTPKEKSENSFPQELEDADNLFKLGICTIYCTDKKVEGFNDPNLQQVAVIAHSDEGTLANPANIIQAYGRNRGLNPHKVPNFFLINQFGVNCLFGVDQLNEDDYQSSYDKANKKFKRKAMEAMGKELGDNILKWIDQNKDALHQVNDEKLAEAVISYCFEILEKLNQNNAFKFKFTEKDYKVVLGQCIAYLKRCEQDLKTGTILPILIKIIATLMHVAANCLRWLAAKKPLQEVQRKVKLIKEKMKVIDPLSTDGNVADYERVQLYQKLISKIPLEETWRHDMARKIVNMNIINEVENLKENLDQYSSEIFLKPLKLIPSDDRKTIKETYPKLKSIIEGLSSIAALSDTKTKKNFFEQLISCKNETDQGKKQKILAQLFDNILNSELTEKTPNGAIYCNRIRKMLIDIGNKNEDDVPKDIKGIQALLRNPVTFSQVTQCIVENSNGLRYLNYTDETVKDNLLRIQKILVKDIKTIIWSLISDPAYKENLLFIKNNFEEELGTILKDKDIAKKLLDYINEVLSCSNPETFIENYLIPEKPEESGKMIDWLSDNILSSKGIKNTKFILANILLNEFFKVIHEANLRFYKVNDQGQVKNATVNEKRFFEVTDSSLPFIMRTITEYDIQMITPEAAIELLKNHTFMPLTLYILGIEGVIVDIVQVDAEGNRLKFNKDTNYNKLCGNISQLNLQERIKVVLDTEQMKRLDSGITSLQVSSIQKQNGEMEILKSPMCGESLIAPSLQDQDTENGKVWRQILGLNTLKTSLSPLNHTNYTVRGNELRKAVEVARKVLTGIQKRKIAKHTNDSLIAYSSIFSETLNAESKANSDPSEEVLGQHGFSCVLMLNKTPAENEMPEGLDINTLVLCRDNDANLTAYWIDNDKINTKILAEDVQDIAELPLPNQKLIDKDLIQAITSKFGCTRQHKSRVEKLKVCFEEEKSKYYESVVDTTVTTKIVRIIEEFITSKQIFSFFKEDPDPLKGAQKVLAEKFKKKLQNSEVGNNAINMLKLIGETLKENEDLMIKHNKKSTDSNALSSVLKRIEAIVENAEKKPVPALMG